MYPQKTYELRIGFPAVEDAISAKLAAIEVLQNHGIDSFVEGAVDDLDIDNEFGLEKENLYAEVGGDLSAVSVYKFSRELLYGLKAAVELKCNGAVRCEILEQNTTDWLDGWKDSFKPIATKCFYIYPPWDPPKDLASSVHGIVIEPGMAFGTGQHATTLLCLSEIEQLFCEQGELYSLKDSAKVCDIGTGTGILAIALAKLGIPQILGTDTDPDAITSAKRNAADNGLNLRFRNASVPHKCGYNLVVANILAVVLERILPEIAQITLPGGYVVLSGILVEQSDQMTLLADSLGMKLIRTNIRDGWVSLLYQRSL